MMQSREATEYGCIDKQNGCPCIGVSEQAAQLKELAGMKWHHRDTYNNDGTSDSKC